jgi:hypothetical protein
MQKWKLYIVLVVYALVSLTPTIYFHGCCCGTEQSWFVPVEDCCDEHEHAHDGHGNEIAQNCCQEDALFLEVDDQPTSVFFRLNTLHHVHSICPNATPVVESETVISHSPLIKAPPLIQNRTILFSQLIFYDDFSAA